MVTTSSLDMSPVLSVEVVADIGTVIEAVRLGTWSAMAIDMPIGLPDRGTRGCDVATRARLGRRGSSVFPAPPRPVLGSASHPEAVARSRAIDGRGITIQTFHILRKIEQLDAAIGPDDVLDAAAIAWSARRWSAGTALVLGDGSTDSRGLPMRVAI